MGVWWRVVRYGFWLLYNPFAFTYDAVSWIVSMGAWRLWTRAALPYVDPAAGWVLELAHGTGNLQIDLARRGYRSVGCDLSAAMGRIARRKLSKVGLPVRLARGKAQALPFANQQFAAVIATFPTDYIGQAETLREVQRVLRADGVFVIVPGAAFTGGGIFRRVLDAAYRVTGQQTGDLQTARAAVEAQITSRFSASGWAAQVEYVPCPRSTALVIVARKVGGKTP